MDPSKKEMVETEPPNLVPIMNLICLLIPFLLYTAAFIAYACIDVASPRFQTRSAITPPEDQEQQALNLSLMITDQGFRLAATGGVLPEGCSSQGGEGGTGAPTVPLQSNADTCTDESGYPGPRDRQDRASLRLGPPSCAYNFDALHDCIVRIKEEYPEESQVVISSEQRIDFDVLIKAMDATRGSDDAPLFPTVILSSGMA